MPVINTVLTTVHTDKHMQCCIGLKALIEGGCSLESLSNVVEELCDQSENIHALNSIANQCQ
jgi:hypothetical protein